MVIPCCRHGLFSLLLSLLLQHHGPFEVLSGIIEQILVIGVRILLIRQVEAGLMSGRELCLLKGASGLIQGTERNTLRQTVVHGSVSVESFLNSLTASTSIEVNSLVVAPLAQVSFEIM